ncbi:glutaminyl-peptide cyclotransferase [Croceivirga thetidis]|uniref:Glutaminyl-peptide cyclotransferase n=1 Tax=Croceivirga thetidis TaxID=2721623 RepID=A0ABX1GU27_9FLAO|nr:glutaminyl-peptide cyclotransferase [Croceivirga thetidis]NKI32526.1 glutaminyl-peptide cyclotransferase [Croceivirga thetidis]
MKRIYNLIFILSLILISCGSTADASNFFAIELEGKKKEFQKGEKVGVAIKNKKEKTINKVEYELDGQAIVIENGKLTLDSQKLGRKELKAKIYFDDTSTEVTKSISILATRAPEIYTYEIINEFPHDKRAFTQGLEFYKDTLYESTGRLGKSTLRKVDFKTGEILQKIDLKNDEFGEGLTIINDQIVQLTWQNGLGYVYDLPDLNQTSSFNYGQSKEGWGLCNDGSKIYKSDGTEKIWILDAKTFTEIDYIETVTNKSIFNKANELEYVDGKIYANVWQKPSMMIIDTKSGAIEGVVNFSGLKSKVEQHSEIDVFNGVAYHPERKTFFVTGKNWSKIFEVSINKK